MASQNLVNPPEMTMMRSTFQFGFNYSETKHHTAGQCISSPGFTAGGYDWFLAFYPQGDTPNNQGSHASLYLNLDGEVDENEISVEYTFQVLDKKRKFITIGNPEIVKYTWSSNCWGEEEFLACDTIEELYCVNGILVISCSIRVSPENSSPLTEPINVQTYPGGLCEHIEQLWEKGERFDITFEVEGQSISAHRFMVAARSPVFEAELFGSMAEAKMECVKIDEMKADVFKALLHFIYTDQLAKDVSNDNGTLSFEMLQGLFVAADRYGLDKLTMLCEEQLRIRLSVDTVVTILILADHYNRAALKKKCLDFASCSENFLLIALTEEYLHGMIEAPSLFAELSKTVKCASHLAKKQRTD